MKVIKEHGPPSFDVSNSSPHASSPGPLSHWGSGNTHAAAASDSDPAQYGSAAADSPRSGSVSSSHNTGSATTGGPSAGPTPAAATAAAGADGSGGSPTSGAAAAAAATTTGGREGPGAVCPADPFKCSEDGACSVDVEQRSIRCIRQMSSEDIIMHWVSVLLCGSCAVSLCVYCGSVCVSEGWELLGRGSRSCGSWRAILVCRLRNGLGCRLKGRTVLTAVDIAALTAFDCF